MYLCFYFTLCRERMGEGFMIESARNPHCPKVRFYRYAFGINMK